MLQKFGFSQYESKVYETLLSSDEPLDATRIVKYSGVPKAKIYEVLSKMIDKGMLLNSVSGKQKMYTALPLSLAIEKLSAEFQADIEQLKINTAKKTFTDDRVWSVKVDTTIKAQIKQLIEEAEQSIRISVWNDDFVEYAPLLEEKEKQGVAVEAHVVGEIKANISNLDFFIPALEHNVLERFQLLVVDEREIMFVGTENGSWQAIKTMSKPFIKVFTEFFYHDIALTKITGKYHDLLMKDQEIKDILMRLRY
ncbi:TrmB family transcriptional regulator [Aneurinibacillus migulanus]|uniref:Sugar-specific transcriptional regulator TrmB n=1 Tax=Aneurinibacillus migulanus TaxID=47500 RepID=A0A0D1XNS9_ANEMI|nr:helix-turn-helix domain-containing protein [Aneurinibacillus migulanus]KIV55996.1 TrmB family transcriptional regulator [Aneurinibacillus migulanus]KIV58247.1 TrmB family transcriptional regulator [Aneurinibacillus migulanus]KON96027.1 TrmB family transcriptional regulator [Aneurinibacillus migulanus]KPD06515.1 TrmB family transcriptional regulator [Aneurinibacillus migulanus]MCP1356601.1 TrmB family transcriptional regulator [Aneurinibacillus migulanus]